MATMSEVSDRLSAALGVKITERPDRQGGTEYLLAVPRQDANTFAIGVQLNRALDAEFSKENDGVLRRTFNPSKLDAVRLRPAGNLLRGELVIPASKADQVSSLLESNPELLANGSKGPIIPKEVRVDYHGANEPKPHGEKSLGELDPPITPSTTPQNMPRRR